MCRMCDMFGDFDDFDDDAEEIFLDVKYEYDYQELLFKAAFLDRLEKAGIDEWHGYNKVLKSMADELDETLTT
jgi:hypothetical protein